MFSKLIIPLHPGLISKTLRLVAGILIPLLAPLTISQLYSQEPLTEKPQKEIPVVYETLRGKFSETLRPMTSESKVISINGQEIPIEELIELELSGKMADSSASATLYLRNGGFWRGRIDHPGLPSSDSDQDPAMQETLFWNSSALVRALPVPIDAVHRYLAAGESPDILSENQADNDLLLTKDGARLEGILESFDSQSITFDDESLGMLQIEWQKVRGFQLVALDEKPAEVSQTNINVSVLTRDGSAPTGTLLEINSQEIALENSFGQEIRIPTSLVLRVGFSNARVISLTDRSPTLIDEGLGEGRWFPWKWQKDRNVLGNPLTIGSRSFNKGIGVHSNSLLTFNIEPEDKTLNGYAGMDSSSRPKDEEPEIGCARFSIWVDGVSVWGPKDISWKDAPVPFTIDLEGKKTFSLKVEMGSGIHILDRANWVSTRIFRN